MALQGKMIKYDKKIKPLTFFHNIPKEMYGR